MNEIIASAGQYGALGLMLLASFWYINQKDHAHQEERKEMNVRFERQHDEVLNVVEKNTSAMVELTTIIKTNK